MLNIICKRDIFLINIQKYAIIYFEDIMVESVDYKKLWKILIDKDIKNKTDLILLAGISSNVLAKLNKGEFVSMP